MGVTRNEFLKLAGAAAGLGLLAAKSGGAESKPQGAAPAGTGAPAAPVSMAGRLAALAALAVKPGASVPPSSPATCRG